MEEADIWKHAQKEIAAPTNPMLLPSHNKEEAKAKRAILDSMKDHFIAHIANKTTNKEMFEALIGLFQNSCVSQQMLLRNKLSTIYMSKTDNAVSYIAKITELKN